MLGDWNSAVRASGLTRHELGFAYLALGGTATQTELDAYLIGRAEPSAAEHNVLAVALNERLRDLGLDSPVPYRELTP